MRVVVIIPAAGLGTRMAAHSGARPGQTTKQFAEIAGKPILLHTLEKFAHVSEVTDIYIAVRENEVERLRVFLGAQRLRPRVHVVIGGDNRQESVANALARVEAAATDVVLVHDAVRPFVDAEIIESVIEAAGKHGQRRPARHACPRKAACGSFPTQPVFQTHSAWPGVEPFQACERCFASGYELILFITPCCPTKS